MATLAGNFVNASPIGDMTVWFLALDASIVAMAGTIPLLAATLIAGAAVDYLGRKRVSMMSDALSALSVAAVSITAQSR